MKMTPFPRTRPGKARTKPIAFGSDTEVAFFPALTDLDEVRPFDFRIVYVVSACEKCWTVILK